MTSRDFCYWLQGFFEVSSVTTIDAAQTTIIKNHLAMVFKHEIDPSIHGTDLKKKEELDTIHHPQGPQTFRC